MPEPRAAVAAEVSDTDADVVIVGLGPVGLFSAILLGRRGYRVIGLDRWPTPYPLPRAVTFDHEIARILHVIGIDSDTDPAIDSYDAVYRWQNAAGEPLLEIDWMSKADDGWRNRYWFSQPALEGHLRTIVASLPSVTMLQGYEVTDFDPGNDHVTVRFQETDVHGTTATRKQGGTAGSVTARYLIGSDGANSTIRAGLGLELTDLDFFYDWLVVDTIPAEPRLFDPPHYQVCDPVRPTTVVPGGPGGTPGAPRRRRWEFMALPGESRKELGTPQKAWELLEPYDVSPENTTLERAVVWRFQAKYLEEWRLGRVMLAGDAAHQMPPFAGEGMCAGLRDANNLCWRLDLALRGIADDSILDGYASERKPHVIWYINFSVDIGRVICITDPAEAAERDERLKAEHAIQSQTGPISPHDAVLGPGAWCAGDELAGKPSVQGRVAYRGRAGRFDEVVGRGWTLVSSAGSGGELSDEQHTVLAALGGIEVTVGPAGSGADVVDIDGVYQAWMAHHDVTHLLVRPDFYVAATASDRDGLRRAVNDVFSSLSLRTHATV